MDQFRRLGLVGRSEVMPKVIHHVEGEEPERQHGLDRVEIEGREVVDSQKGVFGKEILHAPALGIGWHGGVSGHVAGGCDQRKCDKDHKLTRAGSITWQYVHGRSITYRWPQPAPFASLA